MKLDHLTVTGRVVRAEGTEDYNQLEMLFKSGERVEGLVDQFPWMPFIVISKTVTGDGVAFELHMVKK